MPNDTISFSAPKHIIELLDKTWRKEGFSSRSDFITHLIKRHKDHETVDKIREQKRNQKRKERARKKTDVSTIVATTQEPDHMQEMAATNDSVSHTPVVTTSVIKNTNVGTTQKSQVSISKAYKHKKSLAVREKFPYTAGELDVYRAMMHHEIKQSGVSLLEKVDSFRGAMKDDLVYYAIEQADGKNVQYVLIVLKNYLEKGYTELADHPDFQRRATYDVDQGGGFGRTGASGRTQPPQPSITGGKTGWIKPKPRGGV